MNQYIVTIARLDNNLQIIEEHIYDVQAKEARYAPSAASIALRKDYPDVKWIKVLKVIDPNAINTDEEVRASGDSKEEPSKPRRKVRAGSGGVLDRAKDQTKGPAKRGRKPKG